MNRAAYAVCLRLAQRHYENFPVASRLLPKESRPHIAAIYAFARVADDFADEGERAPDERIALLENWQFRLHRAASGAPQQDGSDESQIFVALAETMKTCELEVPLFEDLLSAFMQDVLVSRYETWTDLLDYCRRSANPVGRLVLRVCGYRDAALDAQSDAVCTALQLTNFWQDFERDWDNGRLYVPQDVLEAAGAHEDSLVQRVLTPEWRRALADVTARTRALYETGRPVADRVRGRLQWELRATWLGGSRVLDRLEARRFDVFGSRPRLGLLDAVPILWRTLAWKKTPPPAPPPVQGRVRSRT